MRVVAWSYRAAGVVALLFAIGIATRTTGALREGLYPAIALLVLVAVLCVVLGEGLVRGHAWALAACPPALRPRGAYATMAGLAIVCIGLFLVAARVARPRR